MLKEVIRFEVVRSLKKPSFWVAAILLPVLLIGYILFAGFSGMNAEEMLSQNSNLDDKQVSLMDESKLISASVLENVATIEDKAQGVENVKTGTMDVFYFVPSDLKQPIEVYSRDGAGSILTDYKSKVDEWLKVSVLGELTEEQAAVMVGSYQVNDIKFNDSGAESDELSQMIAPLVGLVVFYVLICIFGNRLTTSTVEEKENRITEMLLTSISAKTLIIGKIVSLILLGFLQVMILVVPILLIFLFARGHSIAGIDLSTLIPNVELNPLVVIVSILLLLLSYLLFVGLGVFVGTLVPTAKEASSYVSVMMILVIMPMFFISSFLSTTPTTVTYVLTFFPTSAPISLFLRFAFGTLQWWEMALGLLIVAVFAALIIRQAIRVFQFGAVELTSKINLKDAFFRK
ncbi:MAG: ABC transporter permease [Candidatus Nomurabacteria bacterium]|nr:ABC transporter permease [Candidatus Nomurabacteria bacterium]